MFSSHIIIFWQSDIPPVVNLHNTWIGFRAITQNCWISEILVKSKHLLFKSFCIVVILLKIDRSYLFKVYQVDFYQQKKKKTTIRWFQWYVNCSLAINSREALSICNWKKKEYENQVFNWFFNLWENKHLFIYKKVTIIYFDKCLLLVFS